MNELLDRINDSKRVVIYGAAKRARLIAPIVKSIKYEDEIKIAVTNTDSSDSMFSDIRIVQFRDLNFTDDDLLLVAMNENYKDEIDECLQSKSVSNVLWPSLDMIFDAKRLVVSKCLKKIGLDPELLIGIFEEYNDGTYCLLDDWVYRKNIRNAMGEIACNESAEYAIENMLFATPYRDRYKYQNWLSDYILANKSPNGINMEFGVAAGESIRLLARSTGNHFYGFDSFEGLPEDWNEGFAKGHFAQERLPMVPENVTLIKGWFNETITEFLKDKDDLVIDFIHIDCDIYSSTKTVFDTLGQYIRKGTIIAFDEYFNYPGWKLHEFKAFKEFIDSTGKEYEYIAYVEKDTQVCVRMK